MSFILIPKNGEPVQINVWNWRPTLELLRSARLIDEQNYELMGANGCGGRVDADTARRIADFIDRTIAQMNPGDRIKADLTITGQPEKQVTFTADAQIDPIDLYSATYEWLVQFRDFSRVSGGFEVS